MWTSAVLVIFAFTWNGIYSFNDSVPGFCRNTTKIRESFETCDHYSVLPSREDLVVEDVISDRRCHIKQMMKFAWDNYVEYAWGMNELRPLSKRPHTGSIFGTTQIGVTIVDSLDTLYMMDLKEEFNRGRQWVAEKLNVDLLTNEVSVFETNIRLVGGLLSCYALTGDVMFRNKAQDLADKLLPAFQTPTGIPKSLVNLKTGVSSFYKWAKRNCSILSEFGTLHLEFVYLSDVTGNNTYRDHVKKIRKFIGKINKPYGLYPNFLNPQTGRWGEFYVSVGALGDSFYEYLLKSWIQSNMEDDDSKKLFEDAITALIERMLRTSLDGLKYFAELRKGKIVHKMDHLGCFLGGLLALASETLNSAFSKEYMRIAKEITSTCYQIYSRSATKLGPESFMFVKDRTHDAHDYYILRPEVIESYFYMYRLTKEEKYREWAWEAVEAIEKHCKVDGGYTGLKDVYSNKPIHDDVQQSFFLAETLKYLYLLYSPDELYSLKQWVFNTEAHPLPIRYMNPYYRNMTLFRV